MLVIVATLGVVLVAVAVWVIVEARRQSELDKLGKVSQRWVDDQRGGGRK